MIKVLFISKNSGPLVDLIREFSNSNFKVDDINDIEGIEGTYCSDVVIIAESTVQIDPSIIPLCKYLQLTNGIWPNIDVEAFNKVGVTVLSASPILAKSVARRTIGMMGVLTDPEGSRGVVENSSIVRYVDDVATWERLSKLKVGIIGYGTVGRAVVELLRSHSVEVIYTDLGNVQDSIDVKNKIRRTSLDQLISRSDIVSVHIPYGPTANPLIGKRELRLFDKTSILINASDRRVICEEGVYTALRTNAIGGFGYEFMFAQSSEINPDFIDLPNIVGSSNANERSEIEDSELAKYIVDNIELITVGDRPMGIVKITQFPKIGDPAFWSSDLTSY